jgi:hypothetical protein
VVLGHHVGNWAGAEKLGLRVSSTDHKEKT